MTTSCTAQRLRIAVDTKNLALYTGGIAAFFRPLLRAWVAARPQWDFVLLGPAFDCDDLLQHSNCTAQPVAWPGWLPRPLRHPWYDNVSFPRALRAAQPDALFTPYHDVRLPAGLPAVLMIHDTCLHDLPDVYPFRVRGYYLHMLRRNLACASRVLTVSQTSRAQVQQRYGLTSQRVGVVPNAMTAELTGASGAIAAAQRLRQQRSAGRHLFYPGGSEHRKNIARLARAIALLGEGTHLWITGVQDGAWSACLAALAPADGERFHFLGRIELAEMAAQYRAADAVVYPTLCEGFGRVALEAMELGVPLACSDIAVLREVAADYPCYFDPRDVASIATAIERAVQAGPQPGRRDDQFQPAHVERIFIAEMDLAFGALCNAS